MVFMLKKESIKKQHLVEAAMELFCSNGFNGVGIDAILKKANVNKMTLYKHFKTKNDLIIYTLEYYYSNVILGIVNEIESSNLSAKKKILFLFEKFISLCQKNEMRCMFVNALTEFPDIENPIHVLAGKYKIKMQQYILGLLQQEKHKNAEQYSEVTIVLLEGSFTMFQATGNINYYKTAMEFIEKNIIA